MHSKVATVAQTTDCQAVCYCGKSFNIIIQLFISGSVDSYVYSVGQNCLS